MKIPLEINKRLSDLILSEEDICKKIEEELKIPIQSSAVMARLGFYSSQRKQISSKIEELKWVLEEGFDSVASAAAAGGAP